MADVVEWSCGRACFPPTAMEAHRMSSPTPAAPSPSAQPTAQPAPGTADAPTTPSPESDAAAPRLAKPTKPIPSLPGVFPDDDPFPLPPSESVAASDPAKLGTSAIRGPDGRFVAAPSPATADTGEYPPQPGQPQSAKFKIAGEEHASQEVFEQQYKSLKGQYRPLQSLARSLGGIEKIAPTLQSAAESARGWKAEADRLTAELASRSGQPAASPTAPEVEASEPADVDWELYAEIKRLATEKGEPHKAEQWLIAETRRLDQARYEKLLDDRFAPIADAEERAAVEGQTKALFDDLATYVNGDGSVAYPELHDEQASYAIGRMWASLGLPPEAALTPQGAIAAIAIYRMAQGNRSQAGSATPSPIAQQSAPPAPMPPTDAHAAADLGDGRVRELHAPGGQGPSAEAARIIAGLRNVNQGSRAVLGFDP